MKLAYCLPSLTMTCSIVCRSRRDLVILFINGRWTEWQLYRIHVSVASMPKVCGRSTKQVIRIYDMPQVCGGSTLGKICRPRISMGKSGPSNDKLSLFRRSNLWHLWLLARLFVAFQCLPRRVSFEQLKRTLLLVPRERHGRRDPQFKYNKVILGAVTFVHLQ